MTTMDATSHFKAREEEHKTRFEAEGFAVLRLDGKGFSKFTKHLPGKPYSLAFLAAMKATTRALCESDVPVALAYTQSDEISLVFDHRPEGRAVWYGGQVQKLVSVTASIATAHFNAALQQELVKQESQQVGALNTTLDAATSISALPGLAYFDARVALTTPEADEVAAYLTWRQRDAVKNSISMLAHHHFGTARLRGISTPERLELLEGEGHPWEQEAPLEARGGVYLRPVQQAERVTYFHRGMGQEQTVEALRTRWEASSAAHMTFEEWLPLL